MSQDGFSRTNRYTASVDASKPSPSSITPPRGYFPPLDLGRLKPGSHLWQLHVDEQVRADSATGDGAQLQHEREAGVRVAEVDLPMFRYFGDPGFELSDEERQRRAESACGSYFRYLALRGARKRGSDPGHLAQAQTAPDRDA
jgi:hypothetical protein